MKMMKEKPDHFFIFEPVNSAVCHLHPRGETDTLFFSENIPALPEMSREETLQITAREAMNLTLLNDPSVEKNDSRLFYESVHPHGHPKRTLICSRRFFR